MNLTWVSLYVIIQKNYYHKFETFRKHPIGIFLFFCRVDKVQIFDPMPYEDVRTGLTFTP